MEEQGEVHLVCYFWKRFACQPHRAQGAVGVCWPAVRLCSCTEVSLKFSSRAKAGRGSLQGNCFSRILCTATSGSLRHKARGPQDVQDADKINTGELSVSYHQLQFTSVLDFTEHKTKGPAPCLFSVKFSKITQTRMLHVKQETAEGRYKKDESRWEQLWKELFVRLQFLVLPNSQMESLGIGASI